MPALADWAVGVSLGVTMFSCMVRQVARHREVIASLERKLQEVQGDFDGLHSQVSHALPASPTPTVVVHS